MYNYNELNAVSLSPTKKDYYQIWNELIEVSSKLSSRWDPSATNESDPGIVLLKVLTAIADKLNYNIDANTLEAFMPSAAQESSMRKLCEMLGYEMRYYQSASTNVRITFKGTSFPKLNNAGIPIDRFTNIQDSESTINYITLEPVTLNEFTRSATVECLEGELVAVQTDTGNTVTLLHLDDNYRFYLPERQVASNGIFISNVGKDAFWTQTDNLNTSLLGSTVYKFGYDSIRGLPYIQFPDDIGSLIGTGLSIYFVRTRGVSGNVSSGFLKTMTEPLSWNYLKENATSEVSGEDIVGDAAAEAADDWSDLEQYSITNLSAAVNGKNPETIDEAYWNYQKQVGTFDTLVTCRDYMNKIYQMTKSYVDTNPLVSNIIVSDVRDDINRAYTLTSFSEQGLEMERLSRLTESNEKKIEYFDLMLYPFQATLGQTQKDFEDSFKYTNAPVATITASLDESKTIAHRFRNPDPADIACIKVYFQVSARLTTTSKISYLESIEVQQAAHQALYKEFNLRNLSFGDELPFDSILQVLTLADPRIKNVTLDDPKMNVVVCTVDGEEYPIITNEVFPDISEARKSLEFYKQLVLDNVMAGRVALLREQSTFKTSLQELHYPTAKSAANTTASCLLDNEMLIPLRLPESGNSKNLSIQLPLTELKAGSANKLKAFMTTRPGTFCCRLVQNTSYTKKDAQGKDYLPAINYTDLYDAIASIKIKLYEPGQTASKYTLNIQPYRRDSNNVGYDYLQTYLSYIQDGVEYLDDTDTEILSKTSFILHPSSAEDDLELASRDFMLCQVPFNSLVDEVFDKVTIQYSAKSAYAETDRVKEVLKQVAVVLDFYEAFETSAPEGNLSAISVAAQASDKIMYGTNAATFEIAEYDTTFELPEGATTSTGMLSADLYWPGVDPTYNATIEVSPIFRESKSLGTYSLELNNTQGQLNQTWRLGLRVNGEQDFGDSAQLVLTRNTADSTWIPISSNISPINTDALIQLTCINKGAAGVTEYNYEFTFAWCKEGWKYKLPISFSRNDLSVDDLVATVCFAESGNLDNNYQKPGLRIIFKNESLDPLDIPLSDLKLSLEDGLTIGPFKNISLAWTLNSSKLLSLDWEHESEVGSALLGWIATPGLMAPAWVWTTTNHGAQKGYSTQFMCGNAYLRGYFGGGVLAGLPTFNLSASGCQSAYVLNNTNANAIFSRDPKTSIVYPPTITVPAQLDLTSATVNVNEDGSKNALTMGAIQTALADCAVFDEESNTLKPTKDLSILQPKDTAGENQPSQIVELSAPTRITSDFRVYTDYVSKEDPLVLAQNEVIQFRSPNFKTTATYPAYVNYYAHLSADKASGVRAAATKRSQTAVPATMQSMLEFFEGGPDYIGQNDYNAYPLSTATAAQSHAKKLLCKESKWNRKLSWEEKINSMPSELLESTTLIYGENDATAATKMQAEYDRLVKLHGAVFTKDMLILSEPAQSSEAEGSMTRVEDTYLSKYKLFEPISKYTMPDQITLTYVVFTQENFETWLRWLRGAVGSPSGEKITYRSDIEPVEVGNAPIILNALGEDKKLIDGIYKRAAASTKRNIGYLVDSGKFKYTELTGLGGKSLKELYVPRLWNTDETSHTANGLGRDAVCGGIPANTEYQLGADEYILISYSTSEGRDDGTTVVKNIFIPGLSIVKPNFELVDSAEKALESAFPKTSGYGPWVRSDNNSQIIKPTDIEGMFTLGATEQIEVREPIEVKLDEAITNLYWEVKDPIIQGNVEKFPFGEDGAYILQPGEYLFYTNEAKESFVYYGSGAEIRRGPKTPSIERPLSLSKMSMDEISSSGLVASMPWVPFNLSANNAAIQVAEYQVINLVEKDALLSVSWLPDEKDTVISNKFRSIQTAEYTVQGKEGKLPSLAIEQHQWQVRGKLEINIGPTTPQTLVSHRTAAGLEQARSFVNIYKNIVLDNEAHTTEEHVVQTFTALPVTASSKPSNPASTELKGEPDTYAGGELPTALSRAIRDGEGAPETTLVLYASSPLVGADGDLRFVDGLECPVFKACTLAENTYSNGTPFAPAFTDGFTTLDLLRHLDHLTIGKETNLDTGIITETDLNALEHSRPALSMSTLIPDNKYFGVLPILYTEPKDGQHFAEICVRNYDGSTQELSIFNYNSDKEAIIYNTSEDSTLPTKDRYCWTWWANASSGSTEDPDDTETPEATPDTVIQKSLAAVAAKNEWITGEKYAEFFLDQNEEIYIKVTGGANTGKWYNNGKTWRLYQSENASLTIAFRDGIVGKTITSVKITYESENDGKFIVDNTILESTTKLPMDSTSVTLVVGSSAVTNKGQIRITAIEVTYKSSDSELTVSENTETVITPVITAGATTPANHFALRPGLNLVVIKESGILDLFVNKSPSVNNRQDLIRIGELKILAWDNMLNTQLAFESHDIALEDTYDTRLKFKYKNALDKTMTLTVQDHEALAYIRKHDPDNKFYYTYQPAQESGLDLNAQDPTDTMALPKAWFDTQNLANKFVVSTLDTEYLTEYVDVSKFSKQGVSL